MLGLVVLALVFALTCRTTMEKMYRIIYMYIRYPMATAEEVQKNSDNCAICWEPMKEARKLPCEHLFHNSCLCRWVQHDPSCPTCRRALATARPPRPRDDDDVLPLPPRPPNHLFHLDVWRRVLASRRDEDAAPAPPAPRAALAPAPQQNRLFHFDGSRYVWWLPSFSVEVRRVLTGPPDAAPAPLANPALPQLAAGPLHLHTHDGAGSESAAAASSRARAAAAAAEPSGRAAAADDGLESSSSEAVFGASSAERESRLSRRKEQLLAAARRRYAARAGSAGRGEQGTASAGS